MSAFIPSPGRSESRRQTLRVRRALVTSVSLANYSFMDEIRTRAAGAIRGVLSPHCAAEA